MSAPQPTVSPCTVWLHRQRSPRQLHGLQLQLHRCVVLLRGQLLREGLLVLGGGWEQVCDSIVIVVEDDDLINGGLLFEEKEEMRQPSVLVHVYSIISC